MTVDRWLPLPRPVGAVRLYCIPHAGGGASSFRPWLSALPGVAVSPVQLPGREARFRDQTFQRMEPLIAGLTDVVMASADGPFAVYGHSVGALIAFELVRELRRREAPAPVHLFVSGSPAPEVLDEILPADHEASDAEIVALLRRLGGTPDSLLADPALLELILPAIKADLTVRANYRYTPEAPLDLPLTLLAADNDPRATAEGMDRWRDYTTGPFEQHNVGEGHFAVYENASLAQKYLSEALRPWL